jgi:hypothetical protein
MRRRFEIKIHEQPLKSITTAGQRYQDRRGLSADSKFRVGILLLGENFLWYASRLSNT